MSAIPTLASTAANAEASQIIPTINGVINQINQNALIGSVAPTSLRNSVYGGDFTTNPWQRGTSFTGITNVLTYTADRFWALGGASSSITVTQGSTSPPPGFNNYLQFGRASSNSNTAAIKLGYVMSDFDAFPYQGQPFVLSFWAKAGANFSAASNALTVAVGTGTATNGSAANYASASWTGFASVTLTGSAGTTVTSVTLTSSWARYVVAGVIPTAAQQIGFNIAYTPVGTAGANDNIQITGIQFEQMPQGGVNPTPFERRPAVIEADLCSRYFYQASVPSAPPAHSGVGAASSTSAALITVTLPQPMRATPTLVAPKKTQGSSWILRTFGGTSTSTINGTITNGSLAQATANVNPNIVMQATANSGTVLTVGQPVMLSGNGAGTAKLQISAEL